MIKYLIEKEFKQLWRNKFILILIILLPCIVMLLFPWATTMEIKNVNITIVDNDRSEISRLLVDKIGSTEYFNITGIANDFEEALEDVEFGTSDIIVEIPLDFEKELEAERASELQFSANAVNGTKASLGTSYLDMIVQDFINELNAMEGSGEINMAGGIRIEPSYWYNPTMDYKIPMIPALIMLVIAMVIGFLPAMNIVKEKETGTIEQINVTPVPKITFIVGKLVPYWCIGIIVFSLGMLVSYLIYHLAPVGNLLLLYGVTLIFIFGISGLGLIISNYSDTLQQAMFVIFFLIVIFILMSGIFTPISSMPYWAQLITKINPLTYFAEIMKLIYLKGSTFYDILPYLYPLLIFFVIIITWAVLGYKKRG